MRDGIKTFLLASQLTLVDMTQANSQVPGSARNCHGAAGAISNLHALRQRPAPWQTLGAVLVPYLGALGADDPALSPDRATSPPTAPVFLLHGHADTVIPTAESVLLSESLRGRTCRRPPADQRTDHARGSRSGRHHGRHAEADTVLGRGAGEIIMATDKRKKTDGPSDGLPRLQKIISQAGIASRRAAEQLIVDGRVAINGVTVRELGTKADPARDEIKVDGRRHQDDRAAALHPALQADRIRHHAIRSAAAAHRDGPARAASANTSTRSGVSTTTARDCCC